VSDVVRVLLVKLIRWGAWGKGEPPEHESVFQGKANSLQVEKQGAKGAAGKNRWEQQHERDVQGNK